MCQSMRVFHCHHSRRSFTACLRCAGPCCACRRGAGKACGFSCAVQEEKSPSPSGGAFEDIAGIVGVVPAIRDESKSGTPAAQAGSVKSDLGGNEVEPTKSFHARHAWSSNIDKRQRIGSSCTGIFFPARAEACFSGDSRRRAMLATGQTSADSWMKAVALCR